jgi:hypothetical protein
MPTDVTRTSTLDRLLRAGGMFIRDEYGAIGLCFVACGRPVDFIEAQSLRGLPGDRPLCQFHASVCAQFGLETVLSRENDPIAACPPKA